MNCIFCKQPVLSLCKNCNTLHFFKNTTLEEIEILNNKFRINYNLQNKKVILLIKKYTRFLPIAHFYQNNISKDEILLKVNKLLAFY